MRITWEKFADVVKGTWHIMGLLLVLIWYIATYKVGLDNHLNLIDQQMRQEDNKLNWLINHHSDKDPMPFEQQFIPQGDKVKPQSLFTWPKFAQTSEPVQDATIPTLRGR